MRRGRKLTFFFPPPSPCNSALDTPLIWATITGNLELAKWLLEHGAEVNFQQSKYRQTALHIAARRANEDMCRLLLAHGADVNVRERGGLTAGQLVSSTHCLAMRKLSADMQRILGVDQWGGAYRDTTLDPENVAFWGKIGPPPPKTLEVNPWGACFVASSHARTCSLVTEQDRERERAERAASKARKAAKRAAKEAAGGAPPDAVTVK